MKEKVAQRAKMTTIRADRNYLDKLAYLARRRKTDIADLVRQALDKEYPMLNAPLSSFFANIDGENQHELVESGTEEHAS